MRKHGWTPLKPAELGLVGYLKMLLELGVGGGEKWWENRYKERQKE